MTTSRVLVLAAVLAGCASSNSQTSAHSDAGVEPATKVELHPSTASDFVYYLAALPLSRLAEAEAEIAAARDRKPEIPGIVAALYSVLDREWFLKDGLGTTLADFTNATVTLHVLRALMVAEAVEPANARVWWPLPPPSTGAPDLEIPQRQNNEQLMALAVDVMQCGEAPSSELLKIANEHPSDYVRETAAGPERRCTLSD